MALRARHLAVSGRHGVPQVARSTSASALRGKSQVHTLGAARAYAEKLERFANRLDGGRMEHSAALAGTAIKHECAAAAWVDVVGEA